MKKSIKESFEESEIEEEATEFIEEKYDPTLSSRIICIELENNQKLYINYTENSSVEDLINIILKRREYKLLNFNRNNILYSKHFSSVYDLSLCFYDDLKPSYENKLNINVLIDELHIKGLLKSHREPFLIFKENYTPQEYVINQSFVNEEQKKIKEKNYNFLAKYYNYNTIHRYSIDFISNNITIGDKGDAKEEILIENSDYIENSNKKSDEINSINSAEDIDINSTGSSLNNSIENSSSQKTKKKKKKKKNQYFSYEKIVFYEGVLCFFFWLLLIFIISFIKCPENNRSIFKVFVCNNCTTMSGYETFFNSKELIIFNNVQYKNELIKYIYNYPICTIIFIIIIIITEFFYHFSFEKIFQGKYKTKLVLILNPIVALVVFGLRILGKKFSDVDSFVEKILPENLNISELILCIALFIGSIVSYLKICDFKCIKR